MSRNDLRKVCTYLRKQDAEAIKAIVKREGFRTLSEYLRYLIREDLKQRGFIRR